MGFIRSLQVEGRSPHLQNVKHSKVANPVDCSEHVLGFKCTPGNANLDGFPIMPRVMRDAHLPFVPADVVRSQDGKDGRRLWIVVNSFVLDVTEYHLKHPGGRSIIEGFGGQDCTWQWYSFHNRDIWDAIARGMRVGRTEGVQNKYQPPRQWVGLRKFGFDFDS